MKIKRYLERLPYIQELSLLVELSELLECKIDQILFPVPVPVGKANFEHVLLPYAPIANFTGRKWPRSMSKPAILAAVKLFMGLEKRRDAMNQQVNDDTEYVFQAAFSGISFGYSWGFDDNWDECLAVYGLTCEIHPSEGYSQKEFIQMAIDHIRSGYPIIVIPKEYTDTILATGYSDAGKILKGIPFLDGDDEKNSIMSFGQRYSFTIKSGRIMSQIILQGNWIEQWGFEIGCSVSGGVIRISLLF